MRSQTQLPPHGERGASLTEYALLIALITVAALASLSAFGESNGAGLTRNSSSLVNAMDEAVP